jgi:hypothetical protein
MVVFRDAENAKHEEHECMSGKQSDGEMFKSCTPVTVAGIITYMLNTVGNVAVKSEHVSFINECTHTQTGCK